MGELSILGQTVVLLVLFQLKHFAADFPLQTDYMLRKTRRDWSFAAPLAVHCAIHAAITLVIVLAVNPALWWLVILDFVTHFAMDRAKAGPRYLGRFNDSTSPSYWNCFGLDQMVHHLTHYYIIWELISSTNP